jgi:hypothetical protein
MEEIEGLAAAEAQDHIVARPLSDLPRKILRAVLNERDLPFPAKIDQLRGPITYSQEVDRDDGDCIGRHA